MTNHKNLYTHGFYLFVPVRDDVPRRIRPLLDDVYLPFQDVMGLEESNFTGHRAVTRAAYVSHTFWALKLGRHPYGKSTDY